MKYLVAGVIIVLLALALSCAGAAAEPANCGSAACNPPNVCCSGTCYPPCPASTAINSQCACVPMPETDGGAVQATPAIVPTLAPKPAAVGTGEKTPQDSRLLVWYDFEDDFVTSGTVKDRSGNSRDGKVDGKVEPAEGIGGTRGIRFGGKGYLLAPDNPTAGRTRVTFSFWFLTQYPDANYKIASAAWWRGGPGSGWTMATHRPEFWADDGPEDLLVPGQPNADNHFVPCVWNHEVVVYDGRSLKEYTNGVLVNTWEARNVPMSAGVPMAVGGWPQFAGYNFVGDMDDFRIYDAALTESEIQGLYRQGQVSFPAAAPTRVPDVTHSFPYVLNGQAGEIRLLLNGTIRIEAARERPVYRGNRTAYYLAYMHFPLQDPAVAELAERIRARASGDNQARIAISLVQNIPYDTAGAEAPDRPMRLPYEVLSDNTGICSEKSLLLAAILDRLGYGSAIFEFPLQEHMAVGIRSPEAYDYDGSGYAFVETTRRLIPTYANGSYGYAGTLSPPFRVLPVSGGRSFATIGTEYADAAAYNRLITEGPRLDQVRYLQWQDLNRKYGLRAGTA